MKTLIFDFLLAWFFVLVVALGARGQELEKFDHVTFFADTGTQIELAWDPVENATYYHVQFYNQEKGVLLKPTKPTTTTTTFRWTIPYTGHFIPRVRACNPEIEQICSEWTRSIDSERAMVDGQPRSWWLYGYVAPPGGIDFD